MEQSLPNITSSDNPTWSNFLGPNPPQHSLNSQGHAFIASGDSRQLNTGSINTTFTGAIEKVEAHYHGDALSIATACQALFSAAGNTKRAITEPIQGYSKAEEDVATINSELSELQNVLELLTSNITATKEEIIPKSLLTHVMAIIGNCTTVVLEINRLLDNRIEGDELTKAAAGWESDLAAFRMSLGTHRISLNLAFQLVSLGLTKTVQEDTSAIRGDVIGVKQDTSLITVILEELIRLRAIVAEGATSSSIGGHDYILERYLDSLTSYAESTCGDMILEHSNDSPPLSSYQSLDTIGSRRHSAQRAATPDQDEENELELSSSLARSMFRSRRFIPSGVRSQPQATTKEHIKLVIVGDGYCGKTTLLLRWTKNVFIEEPHNIVHGVYSLNVTKDDDQIALDLFDTQGQEGYDRLRALVYSDSHVVLICFKIGNRASLDNVIEKWISEILCVCPDVPIILVGLQKDLRDKTGTAESSGMEVSWEKGNALRRQIAARSYLECSSKTGEGVEMVLEEATRLALWTRENKTQKRRFRWLTGLSK